jgi:hypothetical protein
MRSLTFPLALPLLPFDVDCFCPPGGTIGVVLAGVLVVGAGVVG